MSTSPSATAIEREKPNAPPGGHRPPHNRPSEDILKDFRVDPSKGLSTERAAQLLAENGPNQLKPPIRPSRLKILLGQITNAMTIVLLGAMAVSLGTQDWIAAGVIAALVTINVSVGYSQEWKAERVLAGLASVGSPVATVIRYDLQQKARHREGKAFTIPTEEVVTGDIVIVKIGDVVPADARIISGYLSNLECDEALLTGESLPVLKTSNALEEANCPVGDRSNMVYSGSQVTKGRARCVVTMTGMNTELGQIAEALEKKDAVKEKGTDLLIRRVKVALGVMEVTPLQKKLNSLAYILLFTSIVLAVIVVSSTGYHDIPNSIATYAVAAAVSVLPASLIAVLSLTLAVACRELAARNALVRRMDAVETLGGVHNICSDKTGTITVGRMMLKKAWIPVTAAFVASGTRASYDTTTGQMYSVESAGDPYYPRGVIRAVGADAEEPSPTPNSQEQDSDNDSDDVTAHDIVRIESLEPSFQEFVHSAALNNMASIHKPNDGKGWDANGDPTEIALQVFAHKAGRGKPHLTTVRRRTHGLHRGEPLAPVISRGSANIQAHHQLKRVASAQSDGLSLGQVDGHYEMLLENPFDSNIKRMSTVWQFIPVDSSNDPADYDLVVYVKGAVERVLDGCTYVGLGDNKVPLTEESKEQIIQRMDSIAAEGLRVLCLAAKHIPHSDEENIKSVPRDDLENGCSFLGLAGIYDPPRPESKAAVIDALRAGIVVRMLTGDHSATASSIARSVGILSDMHGPHAVMTGQEFDSLTDEQIDAIEELPVVVARCAPETKVRMVEALHRRKQKTVMTGDGVNDSPALKRADVGVAMGLNGSDVAKGASTIVLADDNFSSIVRAIRKGRSVFQNLTKFLVYLLSGNVAEVLVIMIGLAFRRDGVAVYPVAPVAALWINTIAAGPPALALGVEPTAKDAMDLGPEAFQAIFTTSWYLDTIGYGIFMGAQCLANYVIVLYGVGRGIEDILPKCNDHLVGMQPGCEVVYLARGTAFATLQLILMAHAITCKNLTRSIFKMDLWDNTSLLWSAGCLALTTFPILYIPVINTHVFQLDGLTWHWGLVIGQLVVYFVAAELYKLVKRVYYHRRSQRRGKNPFMEMERIAGKKFHVAYTMDA